MTPVEERHSVFAGQRVLVVEDDWLIALDLRDVLQGWGCSVIGPAATVATACQLIEEENPTFGVLDVTLGRETSIRVAELLAERKRPFMLLTALQPCHLNGIFAVTPLLNKPMDEARLHAMLLAHLPALASQG